ncbi:MAG: Fe-S protein assembly co-chaperone HscB [Magnetococcales bacterium]|nr:Fe-S protein assembly co-chaperone HscB [Magnetococcales bacterium]
MATNIFPQPCWSCRGPITESVPFCPTCKIIQPPDPTQNYFGVFSIDPGFNVDNKHIESLYRELQQQFHPDRFATKSPTERRFSMEHVTKLNEALRTMEDPLSLAVYLLQLFGHTVENSSKPPSDPEFLMEVMELRESLEDLDLSRGDAGEELDAMRDDVEKRCLNEISELSNLFNDYFKNSQDSILEQAAKAVDRLRYHNRFLEELDQREEALY